jgi:hypothetical protein
VAFVLNLFLLGLITAIVGDYIDVAGVRHITEDYLGMYTFVPLTGLLTGVLQYGLLRRYLPRMGWWVAATMGGWLLGACLTQIPGWLGWTNPLFNLDLTFLVMGLSIGLGQWLLLRRRLPRSGWWVGANVAGWGLLALMTEGNIIGQFGLLAVGLLPTCATALMLALLMERVQPAGPQGV